MNKFVTIALAFIASSSMYALLAIATPAYATGGSDSCLDPANKSNYNTTIQRGTGKISLKDGKPLCEAQDIVLESMNVPDTWNKKGWNETAIPQTKFASTLFTVPAGVKNFSKTVTVATPDACKNTQIDFYLAPEYQSITTLTGDDERNIQGVLFAGKGDCEKPTEVKDIKVCDTTNYTVIKIKEDEFDATKHSKDTDNCKKPVEKCNIPGKEDLPKDSKDCVETPTTPETPKPAPAIELPHTGLTDLFAPIMGAGSLTASGYYYLTSRNRKQ